METTFPLYRKFDHERTFYKVLSDKKFEELQLIGKKYHFTTMEAKILPEFNYIDDLIANKHWLESSEKEWEERLGFAKGNLQSLN